MIKKNIVFSLLVGLLVSNICLAKGYTYFSSQDESFQELFKKSLGFKNEGKLEDAIESYKKALEINPNHMVVISELCKCFYKLNNSSELEKYAKKGLLIAQKNIVSKYYIALFYCFLGDSYKIAEKYDLAIKYHYLSLINDPYNLSSYMSIGFCLEKVKKYSDAIYYYKQLESVDPKYFLFNNLNKQIELLEKKDLENNPVNNHLRLALNYKNDNKIDEYREELEKVLEIEPKSVEALSSLCDQPFINMAGKDKEKNLKLIKYCEKAISVIDNKIEGDNYSFLNLSLYKRIALLYRNIDNEEMAKEYDIAAKCYEYYEEAEKILQQENNIEKALKYYKKAVDSFTTDKIPYNYNLITTYIVYAGDSKNEDYKDYILKATDRAKKDKNIDRLAEYAGFAALYCFSNKQYEKAIKYYNLAFEKVNYINGKYFYMQQIAKIYTELKDFDKAQQAYDSCIELADKGAIDKYDVASKKIECREKFDKNSNYNKATNYVEKGVRLFSDKKYEEATEYFSNALHLIPLEINSLAYLSQCLYTLKEYEKSAEVANEGLITANLERTTKYYDTFCSNIVNYYKEIKKDNKKALKYALQGYEKKPSNMMRYNVSDIYIDLEQYDKAIEILNKANKNEQFYAECIGQLGYCYEFKNNYEKALEYFEKAYELSPSEEISDAISRSKDKLK